MNVTNGILDQFDFPGVDTRQILKSHNLQARSLDSGRNGNVDMFLAHDKGVAFRFCFHEVYSKEQSRVLKYEKFDDVVLIEYFVSKDFKPVERVHLLPDELLCFEREVKEIPTSDGKGFKEKVTYGEAIGGQYLEAYKKWKEGVQTPGLPLSKWGVFSDGEAATLATMGIFSVEQLAAMPRSKFDNPIMPVVFLEGFERAIQYVNGKINHAGEERLAKQLLELEQEKVASDRALKELQAEMIEMRRLVLSKQDSKGKKKTAQKPKKVVVKDGVIVEGDEDGEL